MTNLDWQAQAFKTTATAYTITDVALLLRNSTATTGTNDFKTTKTDITLPPARNGVKLYRVR